MNPNDAEGSVFLLAAGIDKKPDGAPDVIAVFNLTDPTTARRASRPGPSFLHSKLKPPGFP